MKKSSRDKSDNIGAKGVNFVTYDVVNDQKHIFEALSKYPIQ
jgi:hypothetical protein